MYIQYRNSKILQLLIHDRFIRGKILKNSIQETLLYK